MTLSLYSSILLAVAVSGTTSILRTARELSTFLMSGTKGAARFELRATVCAPPVGDGATQSVPISDSSGFSLIRTHQPAVSRMPNGGRRLRSRPLRRGESAAARGVRRNRRLPPVRPLPHFPAARPLAHDRTRRRLGRKGARDRPRPAVDRASQPPVDACDTARRAHPLRGDGTQSARPRPSPPDAVRGGRRLHRPR